MKSILYWQEERQEAREEGREEGRIEGIKAYIELCQEMGLSKEQVFHKIQEKLNLTEETAEEALEKYWKA